MLTSTQREAVKCIHKWFKVANKQIFVLVGYAGTGKSFLTRYALSELNLKKDEVAFCTFTGKASLVLMKYNDSSSNISTIHRLAYDLDIDSNGDFKFIKKKCLPGIKLIIVDEASMVNGNLLKDLLSFGIPILFIGDHGQLPPIGEQTNLLSDPDFMLTEIMRQAIDNPIIYLSMLVREGKKLDIKKYGEKALVLSKHDKIVTPKLMIRADQVICGYNNTRKSLNDKMRECLGFDSSLPVIGDKVVCLENNWNKEIEGFNLVNGMVGYIIDSKVVTHNQTRMETVKLSMQPDFLTERFEDLYIPVKDFTEEKIDLTKWQRKYLDRMTYGYALTCHKAQGSQWDNVFVFNESFGDEPWRWTYTAITRAKENLILVV